MEMSPLLVSKEQIRLPDGVQHGGVQVQGVVGVLVVGQPGIIPLLPQEDVHPVILHTHTHGAQSSWQLGAHAGTVQKRARAGLQYPSYQVVLVLFLKELFLIFCFMAYSYVIA